MLPQSYMNVPRGMGGWTTKQARGCGEVDDVVLHQYRYRYTAGYSTGMPCALSRVLIRFMNRDVRRVVLLPKRQSACK